MPGDTKVDPESTWMKVKWLAPVVAFSVSVTAIYMQMVNGQQRSEERMDRLVERMDTMNTQIQRMFVDVVMTRQGQSWIEMARALNKEKFPQIIWPDLPR